MMEDAKNVNPSPHDEGETVAQNGDTHALSLEEKITKLEAEALQYKDRWMRCEAELENLRKRSEKEREDALKYGATKFAKDVLGFADNIKRALESCPEGSSEDVKAFIEGIRLVETEIKNVFERQGVQELNPLGEMFDPHFHQAMFEVPMTETQAPGSIAQVIQVGYLLHGRLLRPALVGIVKGA